MDIATKTVTTKVHTAVATPDALKGVAIAAVKNQLGLADASVISADATIGADGAITVEVVESVPDAPAAEAAPAEVPAAPAPVAAIAPIVAPVVSGLVIPTA